MTVSNIATSNASSVGQSNWKSTIQQGREDFQQLLQAMQAGDVSAAQQSYAALQQLTTPASSTSTDSSGTGVNAATATSQSTAMGGNAVLSDWNQLGQALQSGNTSSAQSAFSQLQKDLQAAAGQGHHHHHQAISQAQSVYSAMGDGDGDDKVRATSGATGTLGTTGASGKGALQSDLSAAQQALQSGDTQAAQNLLAKLQQDLVASGHHRHWANAAANSATTNTASTASTVAATAAA
ncbi:MAG TPA: hypothetical protein VFW68_02750 [Rhodocyclaceae bacterium]|nr:hypothetical protein [Rhodocyclaceae bacterium]